VLIDFVSTKKSAYQVCTSCETVVLDKHLLLNAKEEKTRYDLHSDDSTNEGYRKFVSPVVNSVFDTFRNTDKGLDYGCGNSRIVQKMLLEKEYTCEGYDPFYFPNIEILQENTYHYITCCEVIEHFYKPYEEFKKLHQLLKPNGKLILKTNLLTPEIDFIKWWYKNDPTHVCFYSYKSLETIKKLFNFESLDIFEEHIVLTK